MRCGSGAFGIGEIHTLGNLRQWMTFWAKKKSIVHGAYGVVELKICTVRECCGCTRRVISPHHRALGDAEGPLVSLV